VGRGNQIAMRSLTGQTILITGATGGLGRYLAGRLAAAGAHVIVHGRDAGRVRAVCAQVGAAPADAERGVAPRAAERGAAPAGRFGGSVDAVLADLADLRQVDRMADTVRQRFSRLDVLVNNAGVGSGAPGAPRRESADGIELRFAVNYLAGYHLTRRLTPLLVRSAPARVVNIASAGQRAIDFADPLLLSAYNGVIAYAQSKLALIMLTFDLAGELREHGVTVNALHPATFMNTTMVREAGFAGRNDVETGGAATLRLITDPELSHVTGRYFEGTQPAHPDPQADDPQARHRLRRLSDELIGRALLAYRLPAG
jgi:NAD(P)-dependent dehydrogenase (short-subunit alcohol dehydrogenase family)